MHAQVDQDDGQELFEEEIQGQDLSEETEIHTSDAHTLHGEGCQLRAAGGQGSDGSRSAQDVSVSVPRKVRVAVQGGQE